MLNWARDSGYNIDYTELHPYAAEKGHIHVLEWMLEQAPLVSEAYITAIKGSQLETCKWIHTHGLPVSQIERSQFLCEEAAVCGNLDILKWLRSVGCEWGARVCSLAAAGSYIYVFFVLMSLLWFGFFVACLCKKKALVIRQCERRACSNSFYIRSRAFRNSNVGT